jgi:hypothetical protein
MFYVSNQRKEATFVSLSADNFTFERSYDWWITRTMLRATGTFCLFWKDFYLTVAKILTTLHYADI